LTAIIDNDIKYITDIRHYGYGFDNKEVFSVSYSDQLSNVKIMSKGEAISNISRMKTNDHVVNGKPLSYQLDCVNIKEVIYRLK